MPKTTKDGTAKDDEMPSTLRRSGAKAKQTFAKTYDSAIEEYDDERRCRRQRDQKASLRIGDAVGIPGRSGMSKEELVHALQKANDRESARARRK